MSPNNAKPSLLDEATSAVERMQKFDVNSLVRREDLGTLNFEDAVEGAKRLVSLYGKISLDVLPDLPEPMLMQIREQANNDYAYFRQILDFDQNREQSPGPVREQRIKAVNDAYNGAFSRIHPWISYSVYKITDFRELERNARAAIQAARDQAETLSSDLVKTNEQAKQILDDVRQVAAEQGVSQQAIYYRDESADHDRAAHLWLRATIWLGIGLTLYAAATFGIHKVPWLAPTTTYDTVQLAISKVLVFAVLSTMLLLAVKNFLAHRHNSIVNKHRQNALMTYKALVEAGGDHEKRDIVLSYAAACIFGPQPSGFSDVKSPDGPTARSVIEMVERSIGE